MEKILKCCHHTERESIDNRNNYCIFVHADIPVLLFVYCHFTKYELFIHTKLIIVFWCRHITCCALIYSHCTSPKKVKKSAFQHVTNIIDILLGVLFLSYLFPVLSYLFQPVVILVPVH